MGMRGTGGFQLCVGGSIREENCELCCPGRTREGHRMQVSKALTFVLCFIPLLTCECSRTAAPSSPPAEDRTLMVRSGIRAASSAEERRKEAAPLNEPDLVNDEKLLKEVPWFNAATGGPLPLPSPPPSDRPGGLP